MNTSTSASLAVLDTVNSIRLKNWGGNTGNCENGNGNGFLNYLGQLGISSSCHRYEVTALALNGKTLVREQRLFEGTQTKPFLSTQDEKIDFCDSNQRSILQMEFKSCRKGFLWMQNHMELHVSTPGTALGKITHQPQKNKFIIEDHTSPYVSYDMVETTGVSGDTGETFSSYSIYYSTLPHTIFQRHPPSFLAAELCEGQDDGTEAQICFKGKESQTTTCQSLSSQAKALLIGLMALMTTLAPERLQRQIHNEAAYKASIMLLY